MSVAKGIGGGFPMGACLATEEAAKGMTLGTHGSTYGGYPLAMAVGNAVLDKVLEEGFLERVRQASLRFRQGLAAVQDRHPGIIAEVRGEGLLLGLRAHVPAAELVTALRAEGMLVPGAGDNVVRLLAAADRNRRGNRHRVRQDRGGLPPRWRTSISSRQ